MDNWLPESVRRKLDPDERYGLRLTLCALALVLVAIPFGLLLHEVVVDGPMTALDESLAEELHRRVRDDPAEVAALKAISLLGKPSWLTVLVGATLVWLMVRRRVRQAAFLAATSVGGGAVNTLVKIAVGRPRPDLEEPVATAFGNSFPSGHSMGSAVCYGALLLVFLPLVSRRLRPVFVTGTVVLVMAIGISRLALGVHFLSDVLAGYVLGLAWLAASVAAFETWRHERGRPETAVMTEGVEPEEARAVT